MPNQGIALRLLAVFLMAAMSACVHAAALEAATGQIVFWRSALAVPIITLWALARSHSLSALLPRNVSLHLTRGLIGCATMFLSFVSLKYLPVAMATALAYLTPVFSTPFAIRMLDEIFDRRLALALVAGFAGVVFMLVPGFENPDVNRGLFIGAAAGLAYAVAMGFLRVHIKTMTSTESTVSIALSFALICALTGLATLPFGWNAVSGSTMVALAGAGVLGGLGHIASTEALRRADIQVLAPFEYTGMIWALLFDVFIFSYCPDGWSLAGMTLIVAAALLTAFADRIFARSMR